MVPVKYVRRVSGGTVKCFYNSSYRVWKVIATYRSKPHKFKMGSLPGQTKEE